MLEREKLVSLETVKRAAEGARNASANSIFLGEQLLTTDNPDAESDAGLLHRLGMQFEKRVTEMNKN